MARVDAGHQLKGARTDARWQVHEVPHPIILVASTFERHCMERRRATAGREELDMRAYGLAAE
eukprot:4656253-Pyramimonas_sp.AAC.1